MRKVLVLAALIVIIAMVMGCGSVYTNIKTPAPRFNTSLSDTPGEKVGKATCKAFLWVVLVGDCSTSTAMQNGNISKIHHVDANLVEILMGLYGSYTTVVHGD